MRTSRIAGGALAVATTLSTLMLVGATPALAQEGPVDQAYAIGADGLLDIPPTPYVRSYDGRLVSDEVLGLGNGDAAEAGLSVGLLSVEAEAGRAETSVADIALLSLLRADVIRTWCDGDRAGLEIVDGSVLGQALPNLPAPETEIDLSPVLNLRLNTQARTADGSLVVHGLQLVLLPGAQDSVDEPLSPADLPAIGLLGDVLGVDLPLGLLTEGDLIEALGPVGEPQVLVIGHATCTDVPAPADEDDDPAPAPSDDTDSDEGTDSGGGTDDGGSGDDEGDGQDDGGPEYSGGSGGLAPSPTVVTASLPVTG